MPYLLLLVNIEVASKILGSPEKDINTNITYNRTGTGQLAFGLTVVGLGNLTDEAKEKYCTSFSWFFTRKFGIPKDRPFSQPWTHGVSKSEALKSHLKLTGMRVIAPLTGFWNSASSRRNSVLVLAKNMIRKI
ncbi:hypothetical protein C8R45DRAFT_925144 [Mycena sanguinolenta]|nr:hypothetical protein C8R45DRAFT_925144 [Mycena sanguinolenta]